MANLEYDPGILGQEFNKIYAEITNCDIIPPPWYPGRVPQQFFLKKRAGFKEIEEGFTLSTLYDEEYFNGRHFVLGSDGHLKVQCTGTSVYTLDNGVMPTGRNHKFFTMTHVLGNKLNTSSFTGGVMKVGNGLEPDPVTEGTLYYEFPSGSTFTGGEYNQKYLFIKSGTGEGQIIKIEYNNTYRLFLSGEYAAKADASSVIDIYPAIGDVLAFIGIDAIYTIPNYLIDEQPVSIKLPRTTNIIDCAIKDSKLYWFDTNYNVFVSSRSSILMSYFSLVSDLIGTVKGAWNIVQYQDYVLLLSNSRIDIIKELQMQGADNLEITVYSIQNVSRTHGIFLPNAFHVYNQGLYIFTKERRFIAITIIPSGTNRYSIQEQDQGIYMQKFFDLLDNSVGHAMNIYINSQNIYLTYSTPTDTEIYVYETQYLGWHRWKTGVHITKFKFNWLGSAVYTRDVTYLKDAGTDAFQQKIRFIKGEADIFKVKRDIFHKLLIGYNTSRTAYVQLAYHQGGILETYTKTFEQMQYLVHPDLSTDGTQGTNVLGYNIPFIQQSPITSTSTQTNMEIPTGFFYELCIIDLIGDGEDGIVYGGFLSSNEGLLPQITERTNVI